MLNLIFAFIIGTFVGAGFLKLAAHLRKTDTSYLTALKVTVIAAALTIITNFIDNMLLYALIILVIIVIESFLLKYFYKLETKPAWALLGVWLGLEIGAIVLFMVFVVITGVVLGFSARFT